MMTSSVESKFDPEMKMPWGCELATRLVGDTLMSGPEAEVRVGNAMALRAIPLGSQIHNIELQLGHGAVLVRSAGTSAQLMAKEGKYATVRMPSGEMRQVFIECLATIGQVGNLDHQNIRIGKAGRKRWMGRRPEVRGSVMKDRKSVV